MAAIFFRGRLIKEVDVDMDSSLLKIYIMVMINDEDFHSQKSWVFLSLCLDCMNHF